MPNRALRTPSRAPFILYYIRLYVSLHAAAGQQHPASPPAGPQHLAATRLPQKPQGAPQDPTGQVFSPTLLLQPQTDPHTQLPAPKPLFFSSFSPTVAPRAPRGRGGGQRGHGREGRHRGSTGEAPGGPPALPPPHSPLVVGFHADLVASVPAQAAPSAARSRHGAAAVPLCRHPRGGGGGRGRGRATRRRRRPRAPRRPSARPGRAEPLRGGKRGGESGGAQEAPAPP